MNIGLSWLFLLGLLAVDVAYVRWAWLSDEPRSDLATRIVLGVLLGLFTALCVGAFCHWIAAFLKGRLKLEFANRPYGWADTVTGEVVLVARKRLVVERLTVTLQGWRRIQRGRNNSTRREVVYQIEQDVLSQENIHPDTLRFPFRIDLPPAPPVRDPVWPSGLEGVGKFLVGMQSFADRMGAAERLHWTLEARAHLAGADLIDRKTLRFNWTPAMKPPAKGGAA
jgi:hypothetical protein